MQLPKNPISFLLVFNFLLLSTGLFAQLNVDPCYAIKWSRNYGSAANDYLFAMEPTSDGGFIAVGEMRAADREDTDIWVQKINSVGEVIWSRTYGAETNERAKDVKQISNGNFIVLAEVEQPSDTVLAQAIYLMELDAVGEFIDGVLFDNKSKNLACNLQLLPNGNYLVGAVQGINSDVWVIQFDASFGIVWMYVEPAETLTGYAIAKPHGSDILIVSSNLGFSEELETPELENIEVKVIDENQTVLHASNISRQPGGFDFLPTYSPNSVSINNDDLIVGTIHVRDANTIYNQLILADIQQIESRGGVVSFSTDLLNGGFSAVTQLPDGDNLAGLTGLSSDTTAMDVFLFQASSDFERLWNSRFGSPFGGSQDDFRVVAVHVVEDGIVVAANSTSSDGDLPGNFGGVDGWIFKIEPLEKPDLGPDLTICDGEPFLLRTSAPYSHYEWQDGSTDSTFLVTTGGTYSVTVSDLARRCELSDTIAIEMLDLELDLGPADSVLCHPEGIVLTTNLPAGTTFEWQDGSTQSDYAVTKAGIYTVTAKFRDCILTDSISITQCDPCVGIPNAFTPNGDNLNDTFHPYIGCVVTNYNFKIYNRWGEVVFETSNSGDEWDGTVNGKDAPSDLYIYQVTFEREDKGRQLKDVRRGEVVLLR